MAASLFPTLFTLSLPCAHIHLKFMSHLTFSLSGALLVWLAWNLSIVVCYCPIWWFHLSHAPLNVLRPFTLPHSTVSFPLVLLIVLSSSNRDLLFVQGNIYPSYSYFASLTFSSTMVDFLMVRPFVVQLFPFSCASRLFLFTQCL